MANQIVATFTLTADQTNALETTAVTLFEFGDSTALIRVPTRIELVKESGTAYAITRTLPGQILSLAADGAGRGAQAPNRGPSNSVFTAPGVRNRSYLNGNSTDEAEAARDGEAFLFVRDDYSRVLFSIPAAFLQSAARTNVVAFPALSGAAFRDGRNSFSIISNVALASGVGSLSGRIYFDEYALAH
jgi:hypothetical protein